VGFGVIEEEADIYVVQIHHKQVTGNKPGETKRKVGDGFGVHCSRIFYLAKQFGFSRELPYYDKRARQLYRLGPKDLSGPTPYPGRIDYSWGKPQIIVRSGEQRVVAPRIYGDNRARMRDEMNKAMNLKEMRVRFGLTGRETDVLGGVLEGMRNADIAEHLEITEQTVKDHLNKVYKKMRVRNRFELMHSLIQSIWRGRRCKT
jgi:DNA-binding CsgD family transcriptional regulator